MIKHILASMIYFDSYMSKSTNTVIYVCGKCRTQFMLPMEKSVTFTGTCANEIIPSINRSFFYKAKEGGYVRIGHITGSDLNIILRA
jgi:DNA-directed RNA polymerase subunit RPC12/RpoP